MNRNALFAYSLSFVRPVLRSCNWIRAGGLLVLVLTASRLEAGTLTVTTLADSGAGSLRAQIAAAVNGDTINFDPSLTSGGAATITLTTSNLSLKSSVTIVGPGANLLAISGNGQNRVFMAPPAAAAALFVSGLTITNGFAGNGGAQDAFGGGGICSFSALTVSNCVVTGCSDPGGYTGGGIYEYGYYPVVLVNCTVANNTSASAGGGMAFRSSISTSAGSSTVRLPIIPPISMPRVMAVRSVAVASSPGVFWK